MDEMQKVPDVIYLPWQDAMWCVKRIYDTDIEYVPKAYLDAAEQRAKELDLANYDVTQNNRGLWDELTAANRRVAEAEATIDKLYDALIWCSGSGDFAPGGKARKGWLKLAQPLLDNLGEENQKK